MISSGDLECVDLFALVPAEQREYFAAKAADLRLQAGEWLVHEGDPSAFYVLLEGTVEIWKDLNGTHQQLHTRGPATFFGELPILLGSASLSSMRAQDSCRLARFDPQHLQEMINECPAFSEMIYRTMSERVKMVQNYARATPSARATLKSVSSDPVCHAIRSFLFANKIQYDWLHHRKPLDEAGKEAELEIVLDGVALSFPYSLGKIADALGLQTFPLKQHYDLIIVGAGPAGMAAAVYGASEGLSTLLLEKYAVGGQAGTSSRIENYLGFPGGISGTDLGARAFKQARRFGAEIVVTRAVTGIRKQKTLFRVTFDQHYEVSSTTVLLACGVEWRRLEARGIDDYQGKGVFYGASRVEAPSLRGRSISLIGGGNSAGQAAMFFSAYAETEHLFVRGAGLDASMSRYLIEQLASRQNVFLHLNSIVEGVQGQQRLKGLTICTGKNGSKSRWEHFTDALFIMIGADAETAWLPSQVERDTKGFICTGQSISRWPLARPPFALESSLPGLFCAGDVRSNSIKRVASSVGEGSMAVSFIHDYLRINKGGNADGFPL